MTTIDRREFIVGAAAIPLLTVAFSAAYAAPSSPLNYASLMRSYLDAFGLAVRPMQPMIGLGLSLVPHGRFYRQLHKDISGDLRSFDYEHVRMLAQTVYRYARWCRKKAVQFTPLLIPRNGIIEAQSINGSDIPMRLLTVYDIQSGGVSSRMDVLFEVLS